jgi:hypothetical protein
MSSMSSSESSEMALIMAKKELRKQTKNILSSIPHDSIVKQSNEPFGEIGASYLTENSTYGSQYSLFSAGISKSEVNKCIPFYAFW